MARCHVSLGNGKQCANYVLENSAYCQTHDKMKNLPPLVRQADYISKVPSRPSTQYHQVGTNSGHRRLILKARKKYQEGDMRSGAELAEQFGGERNWWSKVIVYGNETPKYLQNKTAANVKRYLDEPLAIEPLGVMDEIGPATEQEKERTTVLPKWLGQTLQEEEITNEYQDSLPPPLTGPTLKEMHEAWLKSTEIEPPESGLQEEVNLLFQRVVSLETMLGELYTHFLATGRS